MKQDPNRRDVRSASSSAHIQALSQPLIEVNVRHEKAKTRFARLYDSIRAGKTRFARLYD